MKSEIQQTETFRKWRTRLKDEKARILIASRLDRTAFGHMGALLNKSLNDRIIYP